MKAEIRKVVGWIDFARCVTALAALLTSIYWSIISFINPSVFHPLKYVFDKFIGLFYEAIAKNVYELKNFTPYPSDLSSGSGTSDQRIILIIEMGIVIFLTMQIVASVIGRIYNYYMQRVLVSRFGEEAYKEYLRQIKEQDIKDSEKMRLEEASQSHYKKWKEYYKSDMPYNEWKEKVIKPFNRQ